MTDDSVDRPVSRFHVSSINNELCQNIISIIISLQYLCKMLISMMFSLDAFAKTHYGDVIFVFASCMRRSFFLVLFGG